MGATSFVNVGVAAREGADWKADASQIATGTPSPRTRVILEVYCTLRAMPKAEPVRLFVTGGTFDKEYNELTGTLYFKNTHLPEMLRLGRCRLDLSLRTLMMIDSLDMTAADRALIVEQCRMAAESRIVITHGTDTMVDTARVLAAAFPADAGKTIVLTGAMIPYAFGSSDGLFNLGSALSFVQVLGPGVYIAMNGRYFPWDKVRKNRETGGFEALGSGGSGIE